MDSIWNDDLSIEIRASFLEMIMNMHVDFQPRSQIKKPELMKPLENTNIMNYQLVFVQRHAIYSADSNKEILKASHLKQNLRRNEVDKIHATKREVILSDTNKLYPGEEEKPMFVLKCKLIDYLSEESQHSWDTFLLQNLKLANMLVGFEVISTDCSNEDAVEVSYNPSSPGFSSRNMDITKLLKAACKILLRKTHHSVRASRGHRASKSSIGNELIKTQAKGQPIHSAKKASEKADDFWRFYEGLQHYLEFHMSRSTDNSEEETIEIRCKLELCDLLHHGIDLRQDYLINNIIAWFKMGEPIEHKALEKLIPSIDHVENSKRPESSNSNKFKSFTTPVIESLTTLYKKLVPDLLNCFISNKNYKLQTKILSIVLRIFSQRKELIKNLQKTKLLSLDSDPEIFLWAKMSIGNLKNLAEQSEIICRFWQQQNFGYEKALEKLENLMTLLEEFTDIMYVESLESEPDQTILRVPDKDRQLILRNLDFHLHIIHFINDGLHFYDDLEDEPRTPQEQTAKEKLKVLFSLCFSSLTVFVKNNSKHQKLLHKHLDLIIANIKLPLGQVGLVCEIFKDNLDLCQLIREDLIKVFVDLIISEGRQACFLQFFETVISVNGEPLPRLQLQILSKLTAADNYHTLLFLDSSSQFTFTSNLVRFSEYIDEPYDYHARLISLLSKCCISSSNFQLPKSKSQKILPLPMVFILLMKKYDYAKLHVALLDFVINIYMDSEKQLMVLNNSVEFQEFITQVIQETQDLAGDSHVPTNFYVKLLEFLSKVSGKISNSEIPFEILRRSIGQLCVAIADRWDLLALHNLSQETLEHIERLGHMYKDTFPINDLPHNARKSVASSGNLKGQSRWSELKQSFSSQHFSKLSKEEQYEFLLALSNISEIAPEIHRNFIIQGMLEYISLSLIYNPPVHILYSVIEFLGYSLSKPTKIGEETEEEALRRSQNEFSEMGAVEIVLNLMCKADLDNFIFYILIDFSNKILNEGNEKVQAEFYNFFVNVQSSEKFFSAIYNAITDFTSQIGNLPEKRSKMSSKFKRFSKLINSIIHMLQLLCENHNEVLQNYLRNQEKSRNSYDLVGAVILLLKELMLKKRYEDFHIISHCFETLTEFIQGPCKQNQKSIINGKFLEVANELLSINEKSDAIEPYNGLSSQSQKFSYFEGNKLRGWMIAHLKYKCLITLHGLLEGQNDNYVVMRMIRAFNMQIFKENLISSYLSYVELYPTQPYEDFLFEHFKENSEYRFYSDCSEQDTSPKYYKAVIEIGFMVYHLVNYFAQVEDAEIKKGILTEASAIIDSMQPSTFKAGILGGINHIGKGLIKAGAVAANIFRKVSPVQLTRDEILLSACSFFRMHTCNIEVVFKGKILKTYFWLPPVCSHLTTQAKQDFHSKVDRSSEKTKIEYLVKNTTEILEDMTYEKTLSKVYGYKLMANQVAFCKFFVFVLTVFLNLFMMGSYSVFNADNDRLWSPSFGNIELSSLNDGNQTETLMIIKSVGTVHCILSGFIYLYFAIKTVPLLVQRVWRQQKTKYLEQGNDPNTLGLFYKINTILKTILLTGYNLDVVYQFGFFTFSVLALSVHYFFFSVHLLDILYRFPSLQSVVMSVILPWKALVLTLVLIIIIVYLFSIWAYTQYYFMFGGNCDSLLMCFRTVFDQGFKNAGGIGMWLDYWSFPPANDDAVARFFYDDLFLIGIVIIMMNIVFGLILDTFTVLREIQEESTDDRENKCFICGMQREDIERLSGRPYNYHIASEHNEWNYLFFLIYLKFKESTEFSGIESFVHQSIEIEDLDWIPQQQGLSFNKKQDIQEVSFIKQLTDINAEIATIQQDAKLLRKKGHAPADIGYETLRFN